MLITRIELENIKSYRHVCVDLRRGTTAISGANGAGKTTLVEAIGFALFGYLPYSQDQFVREGEKFGRVLIRLIGGDDRPYTVERRCGSGSRWLVHDEEANERLEQRADVLDRLHDLFGIERERPLDSLFRDALGVPQGTFTAIFLEPAGKRKQTFDALLQIEDYKTAADNLLDTQKYYKEQILTQKGRIDHLTFLTKDLEQFRGQLKDARQLNEQQQAQEATYRQQLTHYETRLQALSEQLIQLTKLEQRYKTTQATHSSARTLLSDREAQLQTSRAARQYVQESTEDYQSYQQAQEILKRLRLDARQRDTLRQQHSEQKHTLGKIETRANNWLDRLADVANARQKLAELLPLVSQQEQLELQREEALQRATQYKAILEEGQRIRSQQTKCVGEQERHQHKISEIEPLQPVADLLQERNDVLNRLRIQANDRSNRLRHLQEKRDLLREKQLLRDKDAAELRKTEKNISIIEEHRQEAEEMPGLQEQGKQLEVQRSRLEGNIEGYVKSRAQSAGGQCPLLRETCLNIQQRGMVSLESYFDGLLATEHAEVEQLQQQQRTIAERIAQIKRFADALNKIGLYNDKREMLAEQLQRHALEITRNERDVAALTLDLEELKQVERQMGEAEAAYNQSKSADVKVRELAGLYKQVQQLQAQAQQFELRLQEMRQDAAQLKGSDAQRLQLDAQLAALNDPRSLHKTQQSIIAPETSYRQKLAEEQQRQQDVQLKIHALDAQLAVYATLDADIAVQEAQMLRSEKGYQRYLQYQQEARQLTQREEAYQQQLGITELAEQQLHAAEQAFYAAQAAFNEAELTAVKETIRHTRDELATLVQKLQHLQQSINDLAQLIAVTEGYLSELETVQREQVELEDLQSMTDQFRKLLKEAAPHVLKAMLNDISAEANRIFGEVMGDRSAHLSWHNDYEVVLRRQGVDRSFAQLSGGEQMSAALAVRLALLKKLSTLNLAFFDEPTQNMDELRRVNLAEQIRRVRGFDQLIVISHDDTFEQGLDSLIRLNKINGETIQVGDEDGSIAREAEFTALG